MLMTVADFFDSCFFIVFFIKWDILGLLCKFGLNNYSKMEYKSGSIFLPLAWLVF